MKGQEPGTGVKGEGVEKGAGEQAVRLEEVSGRGVEMRAATTHEGGGQVGGEEGRVERCLIN